MEVAIICLITLIWLPILLSWVTGYFRKVQLGVIDNNNPRAQCAQLQGVGARLVAAQSNTWEAVTVYMASILAVFLSGIDPDNIIVPCIIFVVCRIFYIAAYAANQGVLRSTIYLVGTVCCFYMLYMSANPALYGG